MNVLLILPHPNRHYYDVFKSIAEDELISLSYIFLKEQPHYRAGIDWELPRENVMNGFNLLKTIRLIINADTVVLGGLVFPKLIMPLIFIITKLVRRDLLIATEEISFKIHSNKFVKRVFSLFFDSNNITCLAIGNNVRRSYNAAGINKWKFIKFGCFEKKNIVPKKENNNSLINLLAVGSLVPNKNHSLIIKTLLDYKGNKELSLHIAGDGPEKDNLLLLCKNLPTNVRVIFHGMCSEKKLDNIYALADLFIHPSIRDRWGATVSQAVNNSLPLLISNTVGSGKDFLLKESYNGYSFSDPDDFKSKLFNIIDDGKVLSQLKKQSHKWVESWGFSNVENQLANFLLCKVPTEDGGPLSLIR